MFNSYVSTILVKRNSNRLLFANEELTKKRQLVRGPFKVFFKFFLYIIQILNKNQTIITCENHLLFTEYIVLLIIK